MESDLDKERVSLGIKQLTKDTSAKDMLVGNVVTETIIEIDKDKVHVSFEDEKGFIKKTNSQVKSNKIPLL